MNPIDTNYGMNESMTASSSSVDMALSNGAMAVLGIIYLAIVILMLVSMWKLYVKAGKPGWASIIPFYNTYVMTQIIGRPWWWLLLMFVPIVNLVIAIVMVIEFVKSYGKGNGFAVLALFLPFVAYPIMALDNNVAYIGPAGPEGREVPTSL